MAERTPALDTHLLTIPPGNWRLRRVFSPSMALQQRDGAVVHENADALVQELRMTRGGNKRVPEDAGTSNGVRPRQLFVDLSTPMTQVAYF